MGGCFKIFRGVDGSSEGVYGMIGQCFSLIWSALLHLRAMYGTIKEYDIYEGVYDISKG